MERADSHGVGHRVSAISSSVFKTSALSVIDSKLFVDVEQLNPGLFCQILHALCLASSFQLCIGALICFVQVGSCRTHTNTY